MLISVNSQMQSAKPYGVQFKGNYEKTQNGNTYYKTNNALKVGGIYAGIQSLPVLVALPSATILKGSFAILPLITTFGINMGIGAYIDHKRNKHAAEATDYVKKFGARNALYTREDLGVTNGGTIYYESKDGKKYGTRIGAIIGGAAGLFAITGTSIANKYMPPELKGMLTKSSFLYALIATGVTALGGRILGAISDHYANKNAKEYSLYKI